MLPKQKDIEVPLLEALVELGGKGSPVEIYPLVKKKFPKITAVDLEETFPSGPNKWERTINYVRNTLANKKYEVDSPKSGIWRITEKGKERLRIEGRKTNETPTEQTMVRNIHEFIKNEGFTFSLQQITNYYLSLKTKPFVILTGISGTGKTKITELFAQAVCKDFNNQYLLLPVRPDWNDDRNLIGYYNPLTKKYESTPFLDFIKKAAQDTKNPYFLCLDEMNLARVEYYFSTFLSAMELGKKEIKLPGHGIFKTGDGTEMQDKIFIPSNIFFTGTVNMDETTYRFSPKVLDRANTIEFSEIDLLKSREIENSSPINPELTELFKKYFIDDEVRKNGFSSGAYKEWETKNWDELVGFLYRINKEALEKQNLHFGYRIRDEVIRYLYFAKTLDSDDFTTDVALDFQIKQKILPRIKGPESIREVLESLGDLINEYPQSTAKLNQMIGALNNGYTDFYQ